MSLNSSTSGGNPDALENIQLLKDGVKFSDVFTNGEDILDSEDLRIEFDLNILRCHGTDKGDIISESFSLWIKLQNWVSKKGQLISKCLIVLSNSSKK
jgi:hypothetical protein